MRSSVVALCLLTPAWTATPPAAAPVTLAPFHDTWVSSAAPDSSYGASPYLSAESSTGVFERFYMEFNTSSLAGQTISSAVLTLWVVRENVGGDANDVFELYPINSAWNDGLTYKDSLLLTQGTLVTTVQSVDYGINNTTSPAQPVNFDITPLVQIWASGGINKGLMIQLPTTAKADYRFASLEDPTLTIQPLLTVTTSSTPAPPPPDPDPAPAPAPAPSGPRSAGDGDKPCGCGTVAASWSVNTMAVIGALGIVILALVGRRPNLPKR